MSLVETVTIRRANGLLTVPADQVERYLGMGYDIVDASGKNILTKSTPKDLVSLMKAYSEHKKEIVELKTELETLHEKLGEKEAEIKSLKSKKTKN